MHLINPSLYKLPCSRGSNPYGFRKVCSKMLKKTFSLTFLSLLLCMQIANAETVLLEKSTAMVPQGWSVADDDLKFKKGTETVLNDNGEVVEGVLTSDTYLRPTGWRNIINDYSYVETSGYFFPRFYPSWSFSTGAPFPTYGHIRYKDGEKLVFAPDGTVLSGVIDESSTFKLDKNKYGFVTFKEDTRLTFDPDGNIISGVLGDDTYLRPIGYANNKNLLAGFVEFKKGSSTIFTAEGLVASGELKNELLWKQPSGSVITLPVKKTISFAQDGTASVK